MKRLFFICLSALMIASCGNGTAQLRCNYSSTDISTTEDEHVILAGFAARTELSEGIHIPLRSHCLVIADGADKICIISNDLMEVSTNLANEIRDSISVRSGLSKERILMHCIHTHSAPRLGGASVKPDGTNYTYKNRTVRAIIDNAVSTICDDGSLRPFKVEIAKGNTNINTNRCEDGGPRDGTLYAVRFKDADGKPICAAINLACHPVCMGHESLLLSSDYSGVARKAARDTWGCEIFQFTGASGNMDPRGGCQLFDHAEELGAELAGDLKELEFKEVKSDNILKFATGKAELPFVIDEITPEAVQNQVDTLVNMKTEFPSFPDDVRGWAQVISKGIAEGTVKNKLDFNMAAVNIDGIIFFFTQGEPFCEYQEKARASFPDVDVIFAGYTNGQNAYLPSERAFEVRTGYEYELEQMHVYVKTPCPLSSKMPAVFQNAIANVIEKVK